MAHPTKRMIVTPDEIQMCVADVLQNDDIENLDSILRMLNHDDDSWRIARRSQFTGTEVQAALERLISDGLVIPCAEQSPLDGCRPIPAGQDWARVAWDQLWFHLEAAGRDAVHRWWDREGRQKYPLDEDG
jgi:hypothetical protein